MNDSQVEQIAQGFIMTAVQEWGDAPAARIAAVQAVLDVTGFDAKATCNPVFGAMWPKPCEGNDGEAASAWLKSLTESLRRGKVQDEIRQVADAIKARQGAA